MSRTLTEIDADLTFFYAERRKASVAEYSTDSGQGRTSAKRSLADINKTIDNLLDERNEVAGAGGSVFSISTDRGPM